MDLEQNSEYTLEQNGEAQMKKMPFYQCFFTSSEFGWSKKTKETPWRPNSQKERRKAEQKNQSRDVLPQRAQTSADLERILKESYEDRVLRELARGISLMSMKDEEDESRMVEIYYKGMKRELKEAVKEYRRRTKQKKYSLS